MVWSTTRKDKCSEDGCAVRQLNHLSCPRLLLFAELAANYETLTSCSVSFSANIIGEGAGNIICTYPLGNGHMLVRNPFLSFWRYELCRHLDNHEIFGSSHHTQHRNLPSRSPFFWFERPTKTSENPKKPWMTPKRATRRPRITLLLSFLTPTFRPRHDARVRKREDELASR